jgi:hypothetical protein
MFETQNSTWASWRFILNGFKVRSNNSLETKYFCNQSRMCIYHRDLDEDVWSSSWFVIFKRYFCLLWTFCKWCKAVCSPGTVAAVLNLTFANVSLVFSTISRDVRTTSDHITSPNIKLRRLLFCWMYQESFTLIWSQSFPFYAGCLPIVMKVMD